MSIAFYLLLLEQLCADGTPDTVASRSSVRVLRFALRTLHFDLLSVDLGRFLSRPASVARSYCRQLYGLPASGVLDKTAVDIEGLASFTSFLRTLLKMGTPDDATIPTDFSHVWPFPATTVVVDIVP